MENWSKQLQEAIIGSAVLFQEDKHGDRRKLKASPFKKPLSEKLRRSLAICTKFHAVAYPDWMPDDENEGYMLKIDGTSFLRAPVHLVPLVPDREHSEMVVGLSSAVRLSSNSIVAVSGSNAVRKMLPYVSDVDYFEYIPDSPAEVKSKLAQRIFPDAEDQNIAHCKSVRIGMKEMVVSAQSSEIQAAMLELDEAVPERSTIKLDYLANINSDRPIEVSNISAFVGENFDGPGRKATFPFQEVLISSNAIVPSPLYDPLLVGEYVCWLIREMLEYSREGNSLKALKRALSLCRFCWFDELLDRIHQLFDGTPDIVNAERKIVEDIIDSIEELNIKWLSAKRDDLDWLVRKLAAEAVLRSIDQEKKFKFGFDAEATSIISEVIAKIENVSRGRLSNVG